MVTAKQHLTTRNLEAYQGILSYLGTFLKEGLAFAPEFLLG